MRCINKLIQGVIFVGMGLVCLFISPKGWAQESVKLLNSPPSTVPLGSPPLTYVIQVVNNNDPTEVVWIGGPSDLSCTSPQVACSKGPIACSNGVPVISCRLIDPSIDINTAPLGFGAAVVSATITCTESVQSSGTYLHVNLYKKDLGSFLSHRDVGIPGYPEHIVSKCDMNGLFMAQYEQHGLDQTGGPFPFPYYDLSSTTAVMSAKSIPQINAGAIGNTVTAVNESPMTKVVAATPHPSSPAFSLPPSPPPPPTSNLLVSGVQQNAMVFEAGRKGGSTNTSLGPKGSTPLTVSQTSTNFVDQVNSLAVNMATTFTSTLGLTPLQPVATLKTAQVTAQGITATQLKTEEMKTQNIITSQNTITAAKIPSQYSGTNNPLSPGNAAPCIITTLAETGMTSNPYGLAVDAQGNLYVADNLNSRILRIDMAGNITAVAGQTQLHNPSGVAIDAQGDLYIADALGNRILKVDMTGNITKIAGIGNPGYSGGSYSGDGGPATQANLNLPSGVAIDTQGNLFIADLGNQRIRKVDLVGTITTLQANLINPRGVAIDAQGNLYIAAFSSEANSGIIQKLFNNSITTVTNVRDESDVAVDAEGNIYIADRNNQVVLRVDKTGNTTLVAGKSGVPGFSGDNGPANQALLSYPNDVAIDAHGNLYISDSGNHRIRKVTSCASPISSCPSGTYLDVGKNCCVNNGECIIN